MAAADYFREQARECRTLAADTGPGREKQGLLFLATHYEREARRADIAAEEGRTDRPAPRPVARA